MKTFMKNKGFTLIELLAVITIMGILMLIAIPAVSRTIENSRKSTFADTALSYLNAVKKAVQEDQLSCMDSTGTSSVISSKPVSNDYLSENRNWDCNNFAYYYYFDSSQSSGQNLLESGGKSPWQSNEVKGIVLITKIEKDGIINYKYSMFMSDEAGYGFGGYYRDGSYTPNYETYPGVFIQEDSINKSIITKDNNRRTMYYDNLSLIDNNAATHPNELCRNSTGNYQYNETCFQKGNSTCYRRSYYMNFYKCNLT